MSEPSNLADALKLIEKARNTCASAYQAVGALSANAGVFGLEDAQNLLTLLSQWEDMSAAEIEAFLPWPKTPLPANRADDLEQRLYELEQRLERPSGEAP